MRLVVGILTIALAPSIAVAQSVTQSAAPIAPRASVLLLECPASTPRAAAESAAHSEVDSLDTSRLVATLCARAALRRSQMTPADSLRELSGVLDADRHATTPAASAADHEARHDHDSDAAAPRTPADPQLRVHLFADIKYSATDSVGSKNGFALGQFDLFARSQLSENLSVLSEATLTALPKNNFNAKLERLLLTFAPSERFIAAVGRFHTGVGYYNAAYHHGTWFQTAVGRPLIFAIDGDIGVVPIHTLGLSMTGDIPSGELGLRYLAEVGSGRAGQSSAPTAPQPGLNDNNTPSVNLALIARPERIDGLQFGVSVYRDRLTLADTAKAPIDETIVAAHVVYRTDLVELLGEGLLMHHDPRSTLPSNDTRGYYAQASRRFGNVRPYARMDYLDVPATNQLFSFLGRRSGPTAGVRYDFDAYAALKLQASHLTETTRPTMNRFDAQVSFMF